jgi:hypothetical protein
MCLENGGNKFLRNTGNDLQDYIESDTSRENLKSRETTNV